jgi:hypothetical protein
MKKIVYLIQLLAVTVLLTTPAFADDDDWDRGGDGWGHHREHHGWGHHHGHGHHGWGGYPRQRVNNYYPVPQQANYYYQEPRAYSQPMPQYYPSQTQYNYGGGRYCDNRFR